MRKVLPTLCFALILALSPIGGAEAGERAQAVTDVGAGVGGVTERGATYETSFGSIFESDEDFGKNLYVNIYERVRNEGTDKALERVLADRSISREELFAVLPGSNIGELLKEPDQSAKTDYKKIEARRVELKQAFDDAKDLADMEALVTMEVQTTEIFANGDEDDSGFDLLADLDVIEKILFGKEVSVPGTGPGNPPGSTVLNPGSGSGRTPADPAKQLKRKKTKRVLAGLPEEEAGAEGEDTPEEPPPVAAPEPTPEEAAAVCPLSSSFNAAVIAARTQERAEEEASGGGEGGAGGAGRASSRLPAGRARGTFTAGGASGAGGANADQPLEPAEEGDFSVDLPCTERFCLVIEKVMKTESSHQDTDNCIACHIEKINDTMNKTMKHNLVPSKATGNLFEAPKCKRSIFNLKQNFIFIPQPIITPPGDDLIIKSDMLGNLISFWNAYKPFACGVETHGNYVCRPQTNKTKAIAQRVFNQLPEGTTQDKAIQEIRKQVEAEAAEGAETMKLERLKSDAVDQAKQYDVLMAELDVMNGYFEGFKSLYNQLVSGEKDSPCKTLIDKPTCS